MYLFHQFHDFFLCRSSEVFYLLLLTCVHLVIGSQSQCGMLVDVRRLMRV